MRKRMMIILLVRYIVFSSHSFQESSDEEVIVDVPETTHSLLKLNVEAGDFIKPPHKAPDMSRHRHNHRHKPNLLPLPSPLH